MTSYADADDLEDYVGTDYTLPDGDEQSRLLERASQLIDNLTLGRAQIAYDGFYGPLTQADGQAALLTAACAQVEFWLEFGEESDIIGLAGSAVAGRVNISRLPSALAPRARRILQDAGLLNARAGIQ